MAYTGDIDIEIEDTSIPDSVSVGQEMKASVDTNVKKDKGRCELSITWPGAPAFAGEAKTTDDQGRCSWTTTVPSSIPARGTATLTLTVRKGSSEYRTVTKVFDVKK
jgi:hypothetical protein